MALTDAVRPAQAQAQAPSPSPSPSPLPSTSSLAIPSTPSRKDRRRSWFGLVTPTRKDKAQAQQRSVSATAALPAAQEDEVEELDATPQRRSAEESRRAWPSRTVSGSSGNSVGTAHTARNARTARALSYESDSDREVINLDTGDEWEGTGTVRRKQTMRQQRQAAQDAFKTASISTTPTAPAPSALPPPPPRQRDLATLAILSQNNAPVKTVRFSYPLSLLQS